MYVMLRPPPPAPPTPPPPPPPWEFVVCLFVGRVRGSCRLGGLLFSWLDGGIGWLYVVI